MDVTAPIPAPPAPTLPPATYDFQVDGVYVTPAGEDGDQTTYYYSYNTTTAATDGPLVINMGDTIRIIGQAKVCSLLFCPTCLVQLYITLDKLRFTPQNYNDEYYCFAGQVTGKDPDRTKCQQPSINTTSECIRGPSNGDVNFFNRNCDYHEFDTTFVINENNYVINNEYAIALTNSYDYQCQSSYANDNNILQYFSFGGGSARGGDAMYTFTIV